MDGEVQASSPRQDRNEIIHGFARMLSDWGAGAEPALFEHLQEGLAEIPDAALAASIERMAGTGDDWGYHPPDPVARTISRLTHTLVLEDGSELLGAASLSAARSRPVIFLGNHLSFVDANVVDALLAAAGFENIADRLTVVVGPKVFSAPTRRLASLCFGTIKIPQIT